MANEITVNLKLSYSNGYLVGREDPGTLNVSQTTRLATGGAQTIATNLTAINMGSVATAGYAYFRNVSTANYIEIGAGAGTAFQAFARLDFGEAMICKLGTAAPQAKANTAAGTLQYTILAL